MEQTFLETRLAPDPSVRGRKVGCQRLWGLLQKAQARVVAIKAGMESWEQGTDRGLHVRQSQPPKVTHCSLHLSRLRLMSLQLPWLSLAHRPARPCPWAHAEGTEGPTCA